MAKSAKRFVSCVCAVALVGALTPLSGVAEAVENARAAQVAAQQAAEDVTAAVAEGAAVEGELIVVLEDDADTSAAARELDAQADALTADEATHGARDVARSAAADARDAGAAEAGAPVDAQVEQLAEDALLVSAEGVDAAALAERLSQDDAVAYVQPNFVYAAPEGETGEDAASAAESALGGSPEDAASVEAPSTAVAPEVDTVSAETPNAASTPEGDGAQSEGSVAEPAAAELAPEAFVPNAAPSARATSVNDPYWPAQRYLSATGFDDAWDDARVQGTVSVAVLDSAVRLDHEDLIASVDVEHGWDAVEQAPLGAPASSDHGTEVAGIISAACDNAAGIAGASFGANIVPITVLSGAGLTTTTAELYRAMDYLFALDDEHPELNLRVVNMSFGGYGTGRSTTMDRAFYTLVQTAVEERDMVVVGAGGNKATTTFSWPADWDEVISVTSVDASLQQPASFSDHNEHKDIAAPGEAIMATKAQSATSYGTCRGTSFSTPIVSAALSLMFAVDPSLSAERATELLYATADDCGAAGRDDYFGWGLVNAEAAVDAVMGEMERPSLRFPDVDQNEWYQAPVAYIDTVVCAGLMRGDAGLFRPGDDITRAEVFAVIYRAAGAGTADEPPAENTTGFLDAESGQWYTSALNWAASVGIARGDEGLVRPNDTATREEVATIMARYAEYATGAPAAGDVASLQSATDWQAVGDWAIPSMAWANEHGVLIGRKQPDGALLLAPQANATRAEFAKIITETLKAVG